MIITKPMAIKIYGSRGSIPVAGEDFREYGGNTTCLQIISECIPKDTCLAVDGGSGFVPLCSDLLRDGKFKIWTLLSHYHYDHIQGILLAPHTYMKQANIRLIGPEENGMDPAKVMKHVMAPPFHPVDFTMVRDRFSSKGLKNIGTQMIAIHPEGGLLVYPLNQFKDAEKTNGQLPFKNGKRYKIDECLIILLYKANHPEHTISYRFEERPTGKIFVFLTDHEKYSDNPMALKSHLADVHLLFQDSQYSEKVYSLRTSGFGHGTPIYSVMTAYAAGVKKLGLIHHDPAATDIQIKERLQEAKDYALTIGYDPEQIFACADYMTIEL